MANSDASSYVLRYNEISTHLEYAEGNNWIQVPSSGGGTPGGSNGQLQYNNAGAFGGDTGSTTDGAGNVTNNTLTTTAVNIMPGVGDNLTLFQNGPGNSSSIVFSDTANGSNTLSISAPTIPSSYGLTLPLAQGGASTFLQNDGSGHLSWVAGGGSGITQLTGDVTAGPGSGSQAATVASVGGKSAASIAALVKAPTTTAGTGTVSPGSAVGVNQFETPVTGNVVMNGPTSGVDGQRIVFRILNDASHSVTFATGAGNFEFGTTIPSYTNSVSLTDYIGAIYSSAAGLWHIVAVSQGF